MRQTMISRTPVEDKFYRLAEKAIELDFDREKRHEEKVAQLKKELMQVEVKSVAADNFAT